VSRIYLIAAENPVTLREGMGSVLFTCIFLLVGILVAIWWLRRNV
jgi:hypothetical protein